MKEKRSTAVFDLVTLAVVGGTCVVTAAAWGGLPDPLPVHYDLRGHANGWMPRAIGAWVLPALALASAAVIRLVALLVPGAWKDRMRATPIGAAVLAVTGLLCALQLLLVDAAREATPHLGGATWLVLGAFFVVLGLIMPRTRRNPIFGVRTAWTMTSDENWARTHRFAGYAFTLGGLAIAFSGALGGAALAVAVVVAVALSPVVWSWRLARHGV